jgi:hypothetical protein
MISLLIMACCAAFYGDDYKREQLRQRDVNIELGRLDKDTFDAKQQHICTEYDVDDEFSNIIQT